jgi:hypothetical protein
MSTRGDAGARLQVLIAGWRALGLAALPGLMRKAGIAALAAALCVIIAGSASAQKPPPAPDALQAYLQKGNLYDSLEQYKQQVTQQLQALEDEMGPIEAEAEGLCMPRDPP